MTELILRGIFMLRTEEIIYFYQHGSSYVFPEYHDLFKNQIEPEKRHNLIEAYRDIFMHGEREEQLKAAQVWTAYEMATSLLHVNPTRIQ